MQVIQAFVNIPCNGACYRRRTGWALRTKWKRTKHRKSQASFSSHSLVVLCLLLCSCCALCLLIVLIRTMQQPLPQLAKRFESLRAPTFPSGWMHVDGWALKSRASDALNTGFTDGGTKPLRVSSSASREKRSDDGKNKCQMLTDQIFTS